MKTEVWAHRGASGYAPENTLAAFEMAAEMKADGVELDVQMTRDGKLIVIHDETVDRVSDGTGMVRDFTLEELKKLCPNKTHPEYEDVKIPTLQEVYELLRPTGLTVNVELKTGIVLYPGIEEAVLRATEEMGMKDRVWYSSFNHYTVRKIKTMCPTAKTGMLYCDGIYLPADYAQNLETDALHPALYNLQYPNVVRSAKNKGLRIHVWTVNEPEHIKRAAESGVDAVITNYPDRARKIVDEDQR